MLDKFCYLRVPKGVLHSLLSRGSLCILGESHIANLLGKKKSLFLAHCHVMPQTQANVTHKKDSFIEISDLV